MKRSLDLQKTYIPSCPDYTWFSESTHKSDLRDSQHNTTWLYSYYELILVLCLLLPQKAHELPQSEALSLSNQQSGSKQRRNSSTLFVFPHCILQHLKTNYLN